MVRELLLATAILASTSGYAQMSVERGPDCLNVSHTQKDPSCYKSADGEIVLSVAGGSGNYRYNWLQSANRTATLKNIATGTYSCTVTDEGGCSATVSATLVEPGAVVPSMSISASNVTICRGDAVQFTAMALNEGDRPSFQWLVNGIPNGKNEPQFLANNLQDGDEVNCTLISNARCVSPLTATSNTIKVTVHALPEVNAGKDLVVYPGSTVVLNAEGGWNYKWSGGINNGTPFSIDSTSRYTVTGINEYGCKNSDQVDVTVMTLNQPGLK